MNPSRSCPSQPSTRARAGYGSDVAAILFSILMIIGGASGNMVLRGTNSSQALVAAGLAS